MKINDTKIEPMTINLKNEMIKINELLLLHQKTKAILTKKVDALLIVLDTDEAKTKLQQQQIDKVTAKAKEILNYLKISNSKGAEQQPLMLVPFKAYQPMDKN